MTSDQMFTYFMIRRNKLNKLMKADTTLVDYKRHHTISKRVIEKAKKFVARDITKRLKPKNKKK